MNNKLRLGDAGAKGRGVFANAAIPRGQTVLSFRLKERWIWEIPKELWDYAFQVDHDRYIVPSKKSYGRFLNHSCRPNCGFEGSTSIVSLRQIARCEEITIDYSTNVGWEGFAMECRCGESDCRQVIRSYGSLTKTEKGKYGKHVSPYLLKPGQGDRARKELTRPSGSPSPSATPAFSLSSSRARRGSRMPASPR